MQKKFELIRNKIKQEPTLFSDRQRLKNMLRDCFQNEPLYMNLLIMAYDENLSGCLKKFPVLTTPLLKKFRERLIHHNGISKENADWAVISWFTIFGRQINLDNEEITLNPTSDKYPIQKSVQQPTNNDTQISNKPIASIPNFGTKISNAPLATQHDNTKKSKNFSSNKFDLLKRIYKQNFDSPRWAFWNVSNFEIRNLVILDPDRHWQQMPNDSELQKIALNVVCNGQYSERDIIHLRINPQCTFGFALTYDSFCTGGNAIGDNIIKYADISSGENCVSAIIGYCVGISPNENSILEIADNYLPNNNSLQQRLVSFLNAAKKIITPSNLPRKINNPPSNPIIITKENNQHGLSFNQDGYYHEGSWWTM